MRLDGNLVVNALEQAIIEIVGRHEVLRTSFKIDNGTPVQMIAPAVKVNLQVIDLQHLSELQQIDKVQWFGTKEVQQGFDLCQNSLLRFILLQLSPESHVLC